MHDELRHLKCFKGCSVQNKYFPSSFQWGLTPAGSREPGSVLGLVPASRSSVVRGTDEWPRPSNCTVSVVMGIWECGGGTGRSPKSAQRVQSDGHLATPNSAQRPGEGARAAGRGWGGQVSALSL